MLTAVIIAKNEADSIKEAITSASFCDEVIVIDNSSTDETSAIAKKAGATVYPQDSTDFSELRTFGMDKAKGDWILFVDADERVSADLAKEIQQAVTNTLFDAYRLRREDIFWGKPVHHGEVRHAYQQGIIRLMKKGSGKWKGAVHEEFITEKLVGQVQTPLIHHAHDGIKDFLKDINAYSTLRAQELHAQKAQSSLTDFLIRPFAKFTHTYFLLGGFRDGAGGFVYSFMMSFHAFLVRSKLYLLQHPKG